MYRSLITVIIVIPPCAGDRERERKRENVKFNIYARVLYNISKFLPGLLSYLAFIFPSIISKHYGRSSIFPNISNI
jgi:hypothetical protein